jgi:hypothetical protein
MQDRFYGRSDPVARQILSKHADNQGLKPPDDQAIVSTLMFIFITIHCQPLLQTSIFLSSLPAESTELSIRTRVIQSLPTVQPTQLKSVVHIAKSKLVPGVLDLFMSLTFTPDVPLSISKIARQQSLLQKHGRMGWMLMVNVLV